MPLPTFDRMLNPLPVISTKEPLTRWPRSARTPGIASGGTRRIMGCMNSDDQTEAAPSTPLWGTPWDAV